jgi:DNA-3-methyladenine glycosylase
MRAAETKFRWSDSIPRPFYDRNTARVARDLVGSVLTRRYDGSFRLGRITETEAYLGFDDPASHVGRGRLTARTEDVWGRPGVAYVFLAYGVHPCFNAITLSHEPYGGVLVRGIERLRLEDGHAVPTGVRDDGPGKVTRYLRIGLPHNGEDLVGGDIRILAAKFEPTRVDVTPRIGISQARDRPLRFVATTFRDG